MTPSLMKSSQALWPKSWSATAVLFMRFSSPSFSGPALGGGDHDPASFRIDRADDAMAPRHVRGRALELHALGGEIRVGAVHVLDHEIERRLLGGAGLAHALHRRHESHAGRMARLDVQIVHR